MQNRIAQSSELSQEHESKQTVDVKSALGFGGIAAAAALIVVLLLALYACKSKASCCMTIRGCCLKVTSSFDMKKVLDGQIAERQGNDYSFIGIFERIYGYPKYKKNKFMNKE